MMFADQLINRSGVSYFDTLCNVNLGMRCCGLINYSWLLLLSLGLINLVSAPCFPNQHGSASHQRSVRDLTSHTPAAQAWSPALAKMLSEELAVWLMIRAFCSNGFDRDTEYLTEQNNSIHSQQNPRYVLREWGTCPIYLWCASRVGTFVDVVQAWRLLSAVCEQPLSLLWSIQRLSARVLYQYRFTIAIIAVKSRVGCDVRNS